MVPSLLQQASRSNAQAEIMLGLTTACSGRAISRIKVPAANNSLPSEVRHSSGRSKMHTSLVHRSRRKQLLEVLLIDLNPDQSVLYAGELQKDVRDLGRGTCCRARTTIRMRLTLVIDFVLSKAQHKALTYRCDFEGWPYLSRQLEEGPSSTLHC